MSSCCETTTNPVIVEKRQDGQVVLIGINRPDARNAVDRCTADALVKAFEEFEVCSVAKVAVLHGVSPGGFCAGADLKAVSEGNDNRNRLNEFSAQDYPRNDGPMGPTRMALTKPTIAAISGHAVAGGLELASWCDIRVMEENAMTGVLCRRWGVPLIDGGTVRLPKIVGLGNALDMILTGRLVDAQEAYRIGFANRVVKPDQALEEAVTIATTLCRFPYECMIADRKSAIESMDLPLDAGMANEFRIGLNSIAQAVKGAGVFAKGAGRGGKAD
eukprot:CFRG6703T1